MSEGLAHKLAERIHREGPIRFDRFMEAALYDPDGGFFATAGRGAGRAEGDFITSPEVGSLFGALIARSLDQWWEQLGRPDPYVVVDAGAGRGQLARDVLRAGPGCAPALRYVLVERSAALRRLQHEALPLEPPEDVLGPAVKLGDDDDDPEPVPGTGPIVTQTEELPAVGFTGVIVANELLDNLPFRIAERSPDGWSEVRVGLAGDAFEEVLVPADEELAEDAAELLPGADVGDRIPVQSGVATWLDGCARSLKRGYVAVLDYAGEADDLAARGEDSWLRTYRGHQRGRSPLEDPGSQDITADVALGTLRAVARHEGFEVVAELTQAEWLDRLGVDDLVEEGRAVWQERAAVGDIEALKGRSRINEAEVLIHPAGLGAHKVVILATGL